MAFAFSTPPPFVPLRQHGKRGALANPLYDETPRITDRIVTSLGLAANPADFDWATTVLNDQGGFNMALNDTWGDCTIAGVIHLLQLIYASIGEEFKYPGNVATKATYATLLGLPSAADLNASTDTGLDMGTVLNWWLKRGLFGTKLKAYGTVNIRNAPLLKQLDYNFGGLYMAGDIPQSAETQFTDNQGWTETTGQPIGGHCWVSSGWRTGIGSWNITWGTQTYMSWPFWKAYGEEAYVVIPEVLVEAGRVPVKSDALAKLEAECQALGE